MLFLNCSPGTLSSTDLWSEFYIRVTQEKGWTQRDGHKGMDTEKVDFKYNTRIVKLENQK